MALFFFATQEGISILGMFYMLLPIYAIYLFIISFILFVNLLIILSHGTYYIANETFKISPKGIQELYTIHSRMNHNDPFTPCAYALMERKSSSAYEDVFEALKEEAITLGYTLNPEHFRTHYE